MTLIELRDANTFGGVDSPIASYYVILLPEAPSDPTVVYDPICTILTLINDAKLQLCRPCSLVSTSRLGINYAGPPSQLTLLPLMCDSCARRLERLLSK